MKDINIYKILAIPKEKISSKRTLHVLYRIIIIFLVVLFVILLPYIIFSIQHILTGNTGLYTYLDNASIMKGEPINVLIKTSNLSAIIEGMEEEGWKEVPTFSATNQSTWQFSIAKGITPISPRYFDGKIQEASLEGPNGTISHRHHARFWKVNSLVYGTVSYDSDVTVIFRNLIPIPTHTINQNIDLERDSIGEIFSNQLDLAVSYEDNIFPKLYKNNNAGSWYYTDGEIIILNKNQEHNSQKSTLYLRRIYFKVIGIIMDLF